MVNLQVSLKSFSYTPILKQVFNSYEEEYEFTPKQVLRKKKPPKCPQCNTKMVYNGYNEYRNKEATVKIGRYQCPNCDHLLEEKKEFWQELSEQIENKIQEVVQNLRSEGVSLRGIKNHLQQVIPIQISKDTIQKLTKTSTEPKKQDSKVLYYDEQQVKIERQKMYRLTLMNQNKVISDKIVKKKDRKTIKKFLTRNIDSDQSVYLVTDGDPKYPKLFSNHFNKVKHQLCLFHLNKRISNDYPKKASMKQLLENYKLLNIFYNREREIKVLEELVEKEEKARDEPGYGKWLKTKRREFHKFLHKKKLERKRGNGLQRRSPRKAKQILEDLRGHSDKVDEWIRKILNKWEYYTAYNGCKSLPSTNNRLEGYYSHTLTGGDKKQFRTVEGLQNYLRCNTVSKTSSTLFEVFTEFLPFIT